MAEPKTKPNNFSVLSFVKNIPEDQKRKDCLKLLEIFKEVTNEKPKMWGTSIVGFGMYHNKSARSSKEGDWPLTGFSPRKQSLTLYIMSSAKGINVLLEKLGKHSISKACLYIKRLSDVDEKILREIIKKSYFFSKEKLTS